MKKNKVQSRRKNSVDAQNKMKNADSCAQSAKKTTTNNMSKQNVGFEANGEESRSFRLDEDSEHSFELR